MARPKKEVYTQEEVELITHMILVGALGGVNQLLLSSGAQPNKEIGEIIMHLAAGVKANSETANEAVKSLQLDEARLAQLQVFIDGALK